MFSSLDQVASTQGNTSCLLLQLNLQSLVVTNGLMIRHKWATESFERATLTYSSIILVDTSQTRCTMNLRTSGTPLRLSWTSAFWNHSLFCRLFSNVSAACVWIVFRIRKSDQSEQEIRHIFCCCKCIQRFHYPTTSISLRLLIGNWFNRY